MLRIWHVPGSYFSYKNNISLEQLGLSSFCNNTQTWSFCGNGQALSSIASYTFRYARFQELSMQGYVRMRSWTDYINIKYKRQLYKAVPRRTQVNGLSRSVRGSFWGEMARLTVNICRQRTLFRWLGGVAVKDSNYTYETTKYPYNKKYHFFIHRLNTITGSSNWYGYIFEYLGVDEHITAARLGLRVTEQPRDCLVVEPRDRLVAGQQRQRDAQALPPRAAREGRAGGARKQPSVLLAAGAAGRRLGRAGRGHRAGPATWRRLVRGLRKTDAYKTVSFVWDSQLLYFEF